MIREEESAVSCRITQYDIRNDMDRFVIPDHVTQEIAEVKEGGGMRRIPDTFVEEVRRRVDIVDVVSDYVQLRRSGRSYVGLCPFHNERSPSFSVSVDRQLFHCFGCGAGGTVIRFVMDIEGLDFPEATIKLAERAGLEPPFRLDDAQPSSHSSRFEQMMDAHELAAKLYSYILMNTAAGVQALTYLEKRGLSRETAVEFRLGYAPTEGQTLVSFLKRRGFTTDILLECGLAVAVGDQVVDRFRGRMMIPICDAQGKVIAFGGRMLSKDGKPKYLNAPETPIFHKCLLLLNPHAAHKDICQVHNAVLLEGYMDVIASWQAGMKNAVASLGTSLTPEQAGIIRRFSPRVTIAYDGDNAGVKAAKRALDVLQEVGLEVRVVLFPEGMDPDDFIQSRGTEAFQRFVKSQALSDVQFLLQLLRTEADLQNPLGRTEFLRAALEVLASRAKPLEQESGLQGLSHEFHVSMETLKEELALAAKKVGSHRRSKALEAAAPASAPASVSLPKGYVQAGNRILQAMLTDVHHYEFLLERGVDELVLPEQTALLAHLYAFRAQNPEANAGAFLDSLDDPDLTRLASSLLIEDPPELGPDVLEDYLRTIELHHVEVLYRQSLEELLLAQQGGDIASVNSLKVTMDDLQQRIAKLKLPQVKPKSNGGVKEAGKK